MSPKSNKWSLVEWKSNDSNDTYDHKQIEKIWKKKLSTYLIGGWSFKWKRDENAPACDGIPALSSDPLSLPTF